MNQILSTGDKQEKSNTNKIIKVFCIIIIVFSIFFIIQGAYALIKGKSETVEKNADVPNVEIESNNGKATIKITHNKGINKVIYSWNDGEETTLDVENKSEFEEILVIPNGDCTLNITVIDSNNIEKRYERHFEYDPNVDTILPEINISAVPGKITIEATDNKEMSYMVYKWNDGEEIKVEVSGEDTKKIKEEIDAKKGKNTLNVVAVDKNGNKKEEKKEIFGASKPKISIGKLGADLVIKVTDDDEVTKVEYNLNGTVYTKENTGDNKKEFEFKQEMKQGENIIAIRAYNKSGLVQEYVGKCTYNP